LRINPPKNINVDDHVWIGNGVFIVKDSNIGNDCILALRTFAAWKSYPDHIINGGLPVKIIKENESVHEKDYLN